MTARWKPSLEDYVNLAAYLLGIDPAAVAALPRVGLAESALQASFASFGGVDAYPTLSSRPPSCFSASRRTTRREQARGVPAHRAVPRLQRARMGTA